MAYAAGPRRVQELLRDDASRTDMELILEQLDVDVSLDPMGFSPAERAMFDHGIDPR
jgi:hypothetical protein